MQDQTAKVQITKEQWKLIKKTSKHRVYFWSFLIPTVVALVLITGGGLHPGVLVIGLILWITSETFADMLYESKVKKGELNLP